MPVQGNYVEIARIGDAAVFRVVGLGNMIASPAIWGLADHLIGEGVCKLAFELSKCTGLDSTFMGMLVGLTHQIRRLERDGWVCAVNSSTKARDSLHTLGADRFIEVKDALPLDDIAMQRLDVGIYGAEERIEIIRRAHESLVEMDRDNRERFGGFLESLEKEIEKRDGAAREGGQ